MTGNSYSTPARLSSPLAIELSTGLTEEACTRTSTSFGAGVGAGRSWRSAGGVSNAVMATAFPYPIPKGGGPPLLLVHGWPQNWYAWRLVMPALARDFEVIAPDQRGIGLTDKPKDGYDPGTLADDLVALMDALGHRRFALVGTDTGLPIAYALVLLGLAALQHGRHNLDAEAPGHQDDVPGLVHDAAAREVVRDRLDDVVGGLEQVVTNIEHALGHIVRHVARVADGRRRDLDRDRRREPLERVANRLRGVVPCPLEVLQRLGGACAEDAPPPPPRDSPRT